MRMLRWIGEIGLREKKRKVDIRKFNGIENITENADKQDLDGWEMC